MKKLSLFILFIFIGCISKPISIPDWVTHTKNNPEVWNSVGIGLTRQIAIKQATNSIASQISVHLESNFKTIKIEQNLNINEFSKSIINSRVNISLPEVEIEEVILHESTWYARASLNKNKYYSILENKRKNAKESALRILEHSTYETIDEEIKSLFKAYEEIKDYIDIPILVNIENKNVNLYSEIINRFRSTIQSINIIPVQSVLKLKPILKIREQIYFNISSKNGSIINNLPFKVIFNSGVTNNNLISENNKVNVILEKVIPKMPSDILTLQLNLLSLLNVEILPTQFDLINSNSITIEILPLNIFIESEENNLETKLDPKLITPIITQHFIENYKSNIIDSASFCDLKINLRVNTKRGNNGSNDYGIYKSFSDLHFSITSCEEELELFQYSSNQIQGADFTSHKNAGDQAINNLATQIKKGILQLMDKSFSLN
jgi:hypothetical protein